MRSGKMQTTRMVVVSVACSKVVLPFVDGSGSPLVETYKRELIGA